mmetsp:Transcript_408/g.468  ORF Transcript_408/g.468 Transcript_408/m.468 type:complete len:702 (+) Transcript_408:44-2149(+)
MSEQGDLLYESTFIKLLFYDYDMLVVRKLSAQAVLPFLEAEKLASPLIKAFTYKGLTLEFLKSVIYEEVSNQKSAATLFRNNSMATFSINAFTKLVGRPYLAKVLGPLVKDVIKQVQQKSFEVDPNKAKPGENVAENMTNLQALLTKFMKSILASHTKVPRPLLKICQLMMDSTKEKFPSAKYLAIGGFFFLRYVCPAIVTPDGHKVINTKLSMEVRRVLVLASKVLQKIVNARDFADSENFMMPFNTFVKDYQQPLKDFLDRLATPVADSAPDNTPRIAVTHEQYQQSLLEIRTEILKRAPKILALLEPGQREEIAQRFEQLEGLRLDAIDLMSSKRTEAKVQCLVLVEQTRLWCGLGDGSIFIWDIRDKDVEYCIMGAHQKMISDIVATDRFVWTSSEDKTVGIFDINSNRCVKRLSQHNDIVKTLLKIEDGGTTAIWSGATNGTIFIWKDTSGEPSANINLKEPICSMCCIEHSDGKKYVWAGTYSLIFLIDLATLQPVKQWKSHAGIVNSLLPIKNSQVWSCSQDRKICVWDQQTHELIHTIPAHDGRINCLHLITVDGKEHVWSGSFDKTICIWKVEDFSLVCELRGHEDDICCFLVVGDGASIYSGSRDQNINLWTYNTVKEIQERAAAAETEAAAALERKFYTFKNGLISIIDDVLFKLKDIGDEIENTQDFSALVPVAKKIKVIKDVLGNKTV